MSSGTWKKVSGVLGFCLVMLCNPPGLSSGGVGEDALLEEAGVFGSASKAPVAPQSNRGLEAKVHHDDGSVISRVAAPNAGAVQISPRTVIEESIIDFHAGTGNLFVVLRGFILWEDEDFWSVNISEDGGATWNETYYFEVSEWFNDIDAVVVGDYLYVAYYVHAIWPGSARLRRFSVYDGSVDTGYHYHEVVNTSQGIYDFALASNADGADSRLYYLLIESDGDLRYFWTDEDGGSDAPWTEIATGVTNAAHDLYATWNELADNYFLFASFIGTDDNLYVWRRGSGGTDHTRIDFSVDPHWRMGISAYDDVVVATYATGDLAGGDIRYWISYDGGENWWFGTPASGENYVAPDVTLREGAGITILYGQYNPDGIDQLWMRQRDYLGRFWSPPILCSYPYDPFEVTSIELLPGVGYGVVYRGGSGAMFIMMSPIFADGFDSGNTDRWSATAP